MVDLPEVWETWVQSLGRKDPLEYKMETYSSLIAWRILWTEEPDRLQSTGWQRVVRHNLVTNIFTFFFRKVIIKVYILRHDKKISA